MVEQEIPLEVYCSRERTKYFMNPKQYISYKDRINKIPGFERKKNFALQ